VRAAARSAVLAVLAAALGAASLPAQTPQDSVTARLRRAEEALEQLRAELGLQGQGAVRSRSRHTLEVTGQVLVNAFYNSAKTNNSDVPVYADTLNPTVDLAGLPTRNLGAAVRQTRLGLSLSDIQAIGAIVSGTVQVDFYGGQQQSTGGRTYPLPRLRVAAARLDWAHIGLLIGQDALVIAPVNPVSFASFATPLFASSGNLWFRAPQVRLTAETSWSAHLGVQAAALAPLQPVAQGVLLTQPDSAERSGRPSVEGRLYLAWGDGETASEVGVGAHLGWLATTGDTLLQSHAYAADARIALGRHLVIAGEAFTGQALGSLGGAVGQNLGLNHTPVRSRGGWAQLDIKPGAGWEFGGGYGMDDPNVSDLPLVGGVRTGRGRNVTMAGHLLWHPGGGLLFGAEFRRIETSYAAGTLSVNHVNAYAGLAF
jgi:hypothetical protein